MKKGYCGIGIYKPKTTTNMGTLWRSAYLFEADYIFTIGHRYKHQPSDTAKAIRHIPLFNFGNWEEFLSVQPSNVDIVLIEQGGKSLKTFTHPKQVVYVLGAEDTGIPIEYQKGRQVIEILTNNISSLNVAVAGSIVLSDRFTKI